MPYGLKKRLEIEAERKKKREEKARIKAEKEKIKLEEKKIARKKKLRKKQNERYQAKVRKAREAYHQSLGDEKGTFSIYLMKDNRRIKFFAYRWYKVAALQLYHQILEENNSKVSFPQTFVYNYNKIVKHKYELVLTKKIDENEEDNVTLLRNEDGKFIENYLIDAPTHKILVKNDWLIEETFNVYGYHPKKDRKTFSFILDNIILNHPDVYSRLIVYQDKLIHHYDTDLDIVTCKNSEQAIELYDAIEKAIDTKKHPTIFFMGQVGGRLSNWIITEMQKKTGWSIRKCRQNK